MYLVGEGTGKILKKDGEYFLRIPKEVFEDTNFPFDEEEEVWVSFKVGKAKVFVERFDLSYDTIH